MTLLAVDIETEGLDAQKFLVGVLVKENMKHEIFYDKWLLWKRILELGRAEYKREHILNVYSHGNPFDFYGYADIFDKNIKYYSERPFIGTYMDKDKEMMKFLDLYSIMQMPLKEVGDMINLPKMEPPKGFDEGKCEPIELVPYCIRDTEIVMKMLHHIKKRLKENGVNIRRLFTINQIAIQYQLNKICELGDIDFMFKNQNSRYVWPTQNRHKIHAAYRGGRTECFKTGIIENVTVIDAKNAYGKAAADIDFPDLRTEKLIRFPLNTFSMKDLFSKIGLSRALVYNESSNVGLLPIRTPTSAYYPKVGTHIVGTWTHRELQKALESGYTIKAIEWSIVYDKAPFNPFETVMPEIFELRNNTNDKFNYYFFKGVLTRGLGKLAQTRINQEFIVDDINKLNQYIKRGFEQYRGVGYNIMYRKQDIFTKPKKYYAPIIPTLVNAEHRIYMYENFIKIPEKDLVYTDTDSIFHIGDHLDKFDIGNKMGQFKVENTKERALIWGRKTYSIGDKIKMAGVHRRMLNKEDFEKGFIQSQSMIGIKNCADMRDVGKFRTDNRDLLGQLKNYNDSQDLLGEQKLLVDDDIEDFNYFIDYLSQDLQIGSG